jgi:hypothetical protein
MRDISKTVWYRQTTVLVYFCVLAVPVYDISRFAFIVPDFKSDGFTGVPVNCVYRICNEIELDQVTRITNRASDFPTFRCRPDNVMLFAADCHFPDRIRRHFPGKPWPGAVIIALLTFIGMVLKPTFGLCPMLVLPTGIHWN